MTSTEVGNPHVRFTKSRNDMDRVKRIWYLSPMRAAKVQASLRIRAVSPEPPLLAYTSSESRGTFRQKARSLAPLNDWACAVKTCHGGMLEDTNSLDAERYIKCADCFYDSTEDEPSQGVKMRDPYENEKKNLKPANRPWLTTHVNGARLELAAVGQWWDERYGAGASLGPYVGKSKYRLVFIVF